VFDVTGGDIAKRSNPDPAQRNTGDHRLPTEVQPADRLAIDFVLRVDRAQLDPPAGAGRRTADEHRKIATSTMPSLLSG
jgi:hypothetical protein